MNELANSLQLVYSVSFSGYVYINLYSKYDKLWDYFYRYPVIILD